MERWPLLGVDHLMAWKAGVAIMVILASTARAGPLDLDVYAAPLLPAAARAGWIAPLSGPWLPGDPRHLREEGPIVKTVSHVGFAGLGIAGLAASVATGGVAPALGFALVALIHFWRLSRLRNIPSTTAR